MRALSIRQPYAWAILARQKDVENRTQNVVGAHRGRVLIHAGLRLADAEGNDEVVQLSTVPVPVLGAPRAGVAAQLGGIVGAVDIVGVHPAYTCGTTCSMWAHGTGVHIRLENPVVLPRMIPCPGRLGLFTPADDVLDQVRAVLR